MKFNIERWAVVVLLGILTVGCSSIRARTDISNDVIDENEWTVYPGVQLDIKEMDMLARGKPLKSFSDDRSGPGWVKGMIATILAFDLPFSTVFDTLAVPYDLYRVYNPEDFGNANSPSGSYLDPAAEDPG